MAAPGRRTPEGSRSPRAPWGSAASDHGPLPVVLLHGFPLSPDMWQPLLRRLTRTPVGALCTFIAPDLLDEAESADVAAAAAAAEAPASGSEAAPGGDTATAREAAQSFEPTPAESRSAAYTRKSCNLAGSPESALSTAAISAVPSAPIAEAVTHSHSRDSGRDISGGRGCTLARYVDIIDGALAARHGPADEGIVLVGMSFGGYVAFEYCRRHAPGRVRGLVLLDTRAQADTAAHARARMAGADCVLREGSHVLGGRAEETDSGLWAHSAAEEAREAADAVMRSRPAVAAAAAMRAMAARPDSFDTLRGLRVPVLIIVGEEDGISPVADSVQMATAAAESGAAEPTLVVVPQAAHMAAVEQPDAVADAISAYLRRLLSRPHGG